MLVCSALSFLPSSDLPCARHVCWSVLLCRDCSLHTPYMRHVCWSVLHVLNLIPFVRSSRFQSHVRGMVAGLFCTFLISFRLFGSVFSHAVHEACWLVGSAPSFFSVSKAMYEAWLLVCSARSCFPLWTRHARPVLLFLSFPCPNPCARRVC